MNKKSGISASVIRKPAEHADRTVREYLASLTPEKLTELVIEDLKDRRQRRESGDQSRPPANETGWLPRQERLFRAPRRLRPTALQKG
jgi:hypothetical protein